MKTVLFALTLLAASQASAFEFTMEKIPLQGYPQAEWHIATDPESGCQYIVTNNSALPRMGADHQQICKSPQSIK